MKMIAILMATFLAAVSFCPAECQTSASKVRSPSGKLLYKTRTKGDVTEVRSPSGKLLMKTKQRDGTTEVRSPSGKLLQKIKAK